MKKLYLAALVSPILFGQALKLDHLDRLSAKASDTVNVTLDGSLLRIASRFLSDSDSDEVEIKKLVAGLKSILVRSFEFKKEGEYLESDLEAVRAQLRDPAWKKIVEVRSKVDGNADIYLRTTESGYIEGAAVISAEPKELTIVSIDGKIDLEGLRKMAGNFGVPTSIRKKMEDKNK